MGDGHMADMVICAVEPFTSPVWGSNTVVFAGAAGEAIPEAQTKNYIVRACVYAKRHGVYLIPERLSLMGYQCLALISPQGKVLGLQKGMFLHNRDLFTERGDTVEVINTDFGAISLCVDVDIYRPEVPRIAASMGAQILICSQYIAPADFHNGKVISGIWSASQGNLLYAVDVCNAFNCICAPRALTQNGDGFLSPPSARLPMSARLSANALSALPEKFRLNRKLYAYHRAELTGE